MSSDLSSLDEKVFTLRRADNILRFGLFGVLSLGTTVAMPFLEIPTPVLIYQSVFSLALALLCFYMLAKCLNEKVVVRSGELTHFDWLGREKARFSLSEIERVERGLSTKIVTGRGETKLALGLMTRGGELLELLMRKGDSSKPLTEILAADMNLGETVVYKNERLPKLAKPLIIVLPALFILIVLMVLFLGMPPALMSTFVPAILVMIAIQGLMLFAAFATLRKRSVAIGPSEVAVQGLMRPPKRIPLDAIQSIEKKQTDQGYYLALHTREGEVRLPPMGAGDEILSRVSALIAKRDSSGGLERSQHESGPLKSF